MTALDEARAHWAGQADADEWLADQADDWPDHDTRRHMLRRGRWKPIDVLPDISNYQPAA
ncbi:hypothetical protein [Kitasatospora cineracea]|uniref:hypothetical protein n=1 Tax=Kitasatospora cineracea TaxID=88074 RepID=UPI00367F53FA